MTPETMHRTGCGCPLCLGKTRAQHLADQGEQAPDADEMGLYRLRAKVRELEEQVADLQALVEDMRGNGLEGCT